PRGRMPAHLPPRYPRPGEGLRDQILGQLPVTDAGGHSPQAGITAGLVELREPALLLSHIPVTHQPPEPLTRGPETPHPAVPTGRIYGPSGVRRGRRRRRERDRSGCVTAATPGSARPGKRAAPEQRLPFHEFTIEFGSARESHTGKGQLPDATHPLTGVGQRGCGRPQTARICANGWRRGSLRSEERRVGKGGGG